MRIFRHFIRVGNRRVHYRQAGSGPCLLMVPGLIAAYNGDPLQAHIPRLGEMPPGWRAQAALIPERVAPGASVNLL